MVRLHSDVRWEKLIVFAVSAGFDAADGDTLGRCKVSPAGFAHMTHMLSSLANGKLVLALEVCLYIFTVSFI